jgi:hypothetical protein
MKRCIYIFVIGILIFPSMARGEDVTLLLTLKAAVNQALIKNELRIGLWGNSKDGLDPQDVLAMTNGLFDAYFDLPSDNDKSPYHLWWDIHSQQSSQEWKLQIKSAPGETVSLEWKQIPLNEKGDRVEFILVDPDTGKETDLSPPSGFLQIVNLYGTKTMTIKRLTK